MERDGIIYLPRHMKDHSVPPHKINYKANIKALKDLGVDEVVSIYAVGSINSKLRPLEYGLVEDFADYSGREVTFFGGGEEGLDHVSMSTPFSEGLRDRLLSAGKDICSDLMYVTTGGPRLETKLEIRTFSKLGFDVVGMTLATEAVLLKEIGIDNAAIASHLVASEGSFNDYLEFDLGGVKAEKVRFYISASAVSSGTTYEEIECSGYTK